MSGDMSEIIGFLKAGEIRVLAVLTEDRVPGFEDIPTAREQGYDVVAVNWRGLYVPKDISDEDFDAWAARLQAVADSDAWAEHRWPQMVWRRLPKLAGTSRNGSTV